jgi:hypothetical protein
MKLYVGSYHKTGTRLFKSVWQNYKESLSTVKSDISTSDINYSFSNHFNRVSDENIKNNKCVVIIRHPMEIIMSGVRYHQVTREKWCKKKEKKWNNLSYKEKLKTLNDSEKINFEMRNIAKETINSIYT